MIKKIGRIILKYKKLLILLFFLVLFLWIARDVFLTEITSYDKWAHKVLAENLRGETLTMVMKIITSFGSAIVLIPLFLLLFIFDHNKKREICVGFNLILITVLNQLLKFLWQRPRPSDFSIISESGYSFPSGHSMVSTAFYGFLIYLVYKNVKNRNWRYGLSIGLFLLIIAIGISRIYLGVHYASDVIAGFCLAISYLMTFVMIVPKIVKVIDEENKL